MNPKQAANHFAVGLKGEYRAVLNEGTDREVDTGWLPNLITDYGMDDFAADTTTRWTYCRVGTGSVAPANSDTTLGAQVTSTSTVASAASAANSGSPSYITSVTKGWSFAQGAVVANITELGIGKTAAGTDLFSRCLVVDGSGVPTSLTVAAIDQLTIYYRLNFVPSLTDIAGSVTLGGVVTSIAGRVCQVNVNNYAGFAGLFLAYSGDYISNLLNAASNGYVFAYAAASTLGAVTSYPTGTGVECNSSNGLTISQAAYTTGSFYRDVTLSFSPACANLSGGIGCLNLGFYFIQRYQYQFTPAIAKDNTKTLSLTFRVSWARA